jgi:ATP-dependent DNA helicase PIF1
MLEATLELAGPTLHRLQTAWSTVRYLIIDEKSMLGRAMLGMIDSRLRSIFPDQPLPFGGLSVLLFGDFGQLPPVGDTALYWTTPETGQSTRATLKNARRTAYLSFTESIVLGQVMRQADNDPITTAFKNCLARIRTGSTVASDWDLLSTRFSDRVTLDDRIAFQDSVLLAGTKDTVTYNNLSTLAASALPVLRCPARNSNTTAAKATDEQADGLCNLIFLMVGAKVMITRNLWTDAGLTNGTMGEVVEIGFKDNDLPGKALPSVVMISCPSYRGPTPWRTPMDIPIIPITPATSNWDIGSGPCTRIQFPLTLAYAITIHKSQGMTLSRAQIDLGPRDFSAGLSFVALSRVKRLDGILFLKSFSADRLESVGGSEGTKRQVKEDEDRRAALGFSSHPFSHRL